MKVVIFVSYTYPFVGSGIGMVALNQAEELSKRGHDVVLVSANIPWRKKSIFIRNGVRHIKLKSSNFLAKYHIPVPFFAINSTVLDCMKESDIIHVHDIMYPYSFQAVIISKVLGKKTVVTQHIGLVKYPNLLTNLVQISVRKIFGNLVIFLSDKIIFINEEVSNFFFVKSPKSQVLINGVNTNLFKPVTSFQKNEIRKKYGFRSGSKIVLFVGRLVPKKGYEILFDARGEEYHILFVGDGKVPERMQESKNISFMGNIPQESLKEIYSLSDIFVLPSKDEGLPLSIQEALACGIPVVVTKNPGYEKYFDSRVVRYVKPQARDVRKMIIKCLNDKKLIKDAKNLARSKNFKFMSWGKNVERLITVYNSVLEKK